MASGGSLELPGGHQPWHAPTALSYLDRPLHEMIAEDALLRNATTGGEVWKTCGRDAPEISTYPAPPPVIVVDDEDDEGEDARAAHEHTLSPLGEVEVAPPPRPPHRHGARPLFRRRDDCRRRGHGRGRRGHGPRKPALIKGQEQGPFLAKTAGQRRSRRQRSSSKLYDKSAGKLQSTVAQSHQSRSGTYACDTIRDTVEEVIRGFPPHYTVAEVSEVLEALGAQWLHVAPVVVLGFHDAVAAKCFHERHPDGGMEQWTRQLTPEASQGMDRDAWLHRGSFSSRVRSLRHLACRVYPGWVPVGARLVFESVPVPLQPVAVQPAFRVTFSGRNAAKKFAADTHNVSQHPQLPASRMVLRVGFSKPLL